MAIFIDLSQIAISNYMKAPDVSRKNIDGDLVKHMILNSIRMYKHKYGREYGQIIICCDSPKKYWRKEVFPHYKKGRAKQKADSNTNWDELFEKLNSFKIDLRENFPYKIIEADQAEADDVIAILSVHISDEKNLIVSSDKDYMQLHSYSHIHQFSPSKKKFVTCDDPNLTLAELIITGDKGDGVPNIRSDGDTFINKNKRQKQISEIEIGQWKKMEPKRFCESVKMLDNYKRNKQLIDFTEIPDYIKDRILQEYENPVIGTKQKVMSYFIKNKMRLLLEDLNQF